MPNKITKTQRDTLKALDATGIPYEYEPGKRHFQVRHNGVLIGIIPFGNTGSSNRETLNLVAQLRRAGEGRNHGRKVTHAAG